jgi:ankyrin repeat protein
VRLLIEKGANIEAKASNGWTALRWASSNGHEAVVKLLLEKGADVELLLEKGADVDAKDRAGKTALQRAAENGHEAVVKLLVEKGADIDAMDERYGRTALRWVDCPAQRSGRRS